MLSNSSKRITFLKYIKQVFQTYNIPERLKTLEHHHKLKIKIKTKHIGMGSVA